MKKHNKLFFKRQNNIIRSFFQKTYSLLGANDGMLGANDGMLGANDGLPAPNNQERRITSLEKNVHT